jgi:hypothetical protein
MTETTTLFQSYLNLKGQRQSLLDQEAELESNVREMQLQLRELNRQEETYDQVFTDLTEHPPKKGFFTALGLRSTQDWTLATFFFCYTLFSIIFTLYAIRFSQTKIWAALFVLTIMFSFGVFFTLALVHYG